MSLIATGHSHGPNSTASAMNPRMPAPASASRWRRNRRHASMPSETGFGSRSAPAAALTVGDAGVEPDIGDVGQQVEKDHEDRKHERDRHDHRGVVGANRRAQKRRDAGNAAALLGDDRS